MTARKRFTNAQIKALKAKSQRYEVWEGGGFGMRVSPKGVKAWTWLYRFDGKPRRMTFGTYPQMTLHSARVELATAQDRLAKGEDPGIALQEERQEERRAETIEQLAEDFIAKYTPKMRSGYDYERALRRDVIPKWGARKANSIKRRDVADLLDGIANRGAPIQANRTLAIIRRMFNWAVKRGALEFNPAAGSEGPGTETPRTRNLTPTEIRTLWHGLPDTDMHELIQLALKLSLVTGQRRGEVVKAKRDAFSLDGDSTWIVPAADSKNKRPNLVPLSSFAVAICKEIVAVAGESKWMFPSPRNNNRPVTEGAVTQALRRNLAALKLEDVRPHDMRRAASTGLASVGVPKVVRERILNHSLGRLDQAYDLHEYTVEKRTALQQWANRLAAILSEDKKVIELDARTA
ncbi:MAG: tyrosine-type recombinase/integrase [Proteobacteria bacterium]|nr:tyrosine-type recombinase/integrase [Pseudomonadota bacterium]